MRVKTVKKNIPYIVIGVLALLIHIIVYINLANKQLIPKINEYRGKNEKSRE